MCDCLLSPRLPRAKRRRSPQASGANADPSSSLASLGSSAVALRSSPLSPARRHGDKRCAATEVRGQI